MSELKSYILKDKKISLQKQCDLLGVARSSFYHKSKGESEENLAIMRHIDDEFLEHPTHNRTSLLNIEKLEGLNYKSLKENLKLQKIDSHVKKIPYSIKEQITDRLS